jgi:hypothetical protein
MNDRKSQNTGVALEGAHVEKVMQKYHLAQKYKKYFNDFNRNCTSMEPGHITQSKSLRLLLHKQTT